MTGTAYSSRAPGLVPSFWLCVCGFFLIDLFLFACLFAFACVLYVQCWHFLCIVHSWLLLWFFLTFISKGNTQVMKIVQELIIFNTRSDWKYNNLHTFTVKRLVAPCCVMGARQYRTTVVRFISIHTWECNCFIKVVVHFMWCIYCIWWIVFSRWQTFYCFKINQEIIDNRWYWDSNSPNF